MKIASGTNAEARVWGTPAQTVIPLFKNYAK